MRIHLFISDEVIHRIAHSSLSHYYIQSIETDGESTYTRIRCDASWRDRLNDANDSYPQTQISTNFAKFISSTPLVPPLAIKMDSGEVWMSMWCIPFVNSSNIHLRRCGMHINQSCVLSIHFFFDLESWPLLTPIISLASFVRVNGRHCARKILRCRIHRRNVHFEFESQL